MLLIRAIYYVPTICWYQYSDSCGWLKWPTVTYRQQSRTVTVNVLIIYVTLHRQLRTYKYRKTKWKEALQRNKSVRNCLMSLRSDKNTIYLILQLIYYVVITIYIILIELFLFIQRTKEKNMNKNTTKKKASSWM